MLMFVFFLFLAVPADCLEVIFEGAVFSDSSNFVDAHYDRVNDTARKQMKQVQSGAQAPKWKSYKERYGMQLSNIIEGFTVDNGQEHVMEAPERYQTRKKAQGKKLEQLLQQTTQLKQAILQCLRCPNMFLECSMVQQDVQLIGKRE